MTHPLHLLQVQDGIACHSELDPPQLFSLLRSLTADDLQAVGLSLHANDEPRVQWARLSLPVDQANDAAAARALPLRFVGR